MKRKSIVGLIVLVLVITGGGIYYSGASEKTEVDAVEFLEYPLSRTDLEKSISTTGSILPSNSESIYSQVNGQVKSVYFKVGDSVNKDDLIVQLDDTDLQEEKLNQENTILNLQNDLKSLKNQGNQNLINQYELSKLNLEEKTETLNNNKLLYETGSVSKETLTLSENNYASALSDYQLAESNLENSNLSDAINLLEKQIALEELKLKNIVLDLESAKITAPISGTLNTLAVEKGQNINSGLEVANIINLESFEIKAEISEFEIDDLKVEQVVSFTTLSQPDAPFKGHISSISKTANASNDIATIEITISIDEDKKFLPNTSANLVISLANVSDVFAVPYDALTETPKGYFITTINDEKILVETGVESDLLVEIKSETLTEETILKIPTTATSIIPDDKGLMVPGTGGGSGMRGGGK